jgi:DNA-binding transcriptional LysR family regulator
MSDFDPLDLDGRTLKLFLAVLEEGSVTRAAERLGLTQSAVSHALNRLRPIAQDPLFVKSGRNIVATPQATALAERARALLEDLKAFATPPSFAPDQIERRFTIAANDFQRDLLLPGFFRAVREQAPKLALRVIPSGAPGAELLREERCDLIVTPIPPGGTDIIQKRLLTDRFACFYDAAVRDAPKTLKAYLDAEHVTVVFEPNQALEYDKALEAGDIRRHVAVTLPNFAGVAAFVRGTALLATLPSLLAQGTMRGLAHTRVPFDGPDLPMYMVWHARHQNDPAHRWLRERMIETAQQAAGG